MIYSDEDEHLTIKWSISYNSFSTSITVAEHAFVPIEH